MVPVLYIINYYHVLSFNQCWNFGSKGNYTSDQWFMGWFHPELHIFRRRFAELGEFQPSAPKFSSSQVAERGSCPARAARGYGQSIQQVLYRKCFGRLNVLTKEEDTVVEDTVNVVVHPKKHGKAKSEASDTQMEDRLRHGKQICKTCKKTI